MKIKSRYINLYLFIQTSDVFKLEKEKENQINFVHN